MKIHNLFRMSHTFGIDDFLVLKIFIIDVNWKIIDLNYTDD